MVSVNDKSLVWLDNGVCDSGNDVDISDDDVNTVVDMAILWDMDDGTDDVTDEADDATISSDDVIAREDDGTLGDGEMEPSTP